MEINKVKAGLKFFLDLIFPRQCLGCKKEGAWLCPSCFDKLEFKKTGECVFCGLLSESGRTCPVCKKEKALDGVLVAGNYEEEVLSEAIHFLKYKYCEGLAPILAEFVSKFFKEKVKKHFFPSSNWLLVPIPLHRRRYNERGFNQSELLAQELAKREGFKLGLDLIKRKDYTKPQVGLDAQTRKVNLKGAFIVNPERPRACRGGAEGLRVILLDDVVTTGSTMEEGAKALKEAGAKEVWGLALAKG